MGRMPCEWFPGGCRQGHSNTWLPRVPESRCSQLGIVPDAHVRAVPAAYRVPTASIKHAAAASDPASPSAPSAAALPIPTELATPSQVFPDGGFPSQSAAEGAIPETGPQQGVGGLYSPLPPPSPDYSRPGVGVRPFSDYAPPGMQRMDPQGGIGAALYRPLPIPSPEQMPTDLEREKFVTRGLFPGTYLVPATNTSFKWYGFVRLDGIYDFNPIGGTDSFVTARFRFPRAVVKTLP